MVAAGRGEVVELGGRLARAWTMQSVCVWASFNGVPARVDVEMHHQLLVAMAAHVEPHACELRDRPIVASFVCRVFTS